MILHAKFQIMFDSYQLYLFCITSVLLALTPGPDILTVVARGISQGRKSALVAAAGFSLGCLNHTMILVLGMAALLKASPTAFSVIKYLGGAYLVYIGIQMFRHRKHLLALRANMETNLKKVFIQSILANLLNPKVALFFLAFLPQFVNPEFGHQSLQLFCLGIIFMLVTLAVFIIMGLFAGTVGNRLKEHPKIFSGMQGLTGIFLIGLGLRLALQKL